jgi:hypothetical protein
MPFYNLINHCQQRRAKDSLGEERKHDQSKQTDEYCLFKAQGQPQVMFSKTTNAEELVFCSTTQHTHSLHQQEIVRKRTRNPQLSQVGATTR